MNKISILIVLVILCYLSACSEGGIGGTGGIIAPDPSPISNTTMSGQGNKGPFANASILSIQTVNNDGSVSNVVRNGTFSDLGAFTFSAEAGSTQLVSINGSFFSENEGVTTSESIELKAVIEVGDSQANVNVATHLIHQRIIQLITDGMATVTAINVAEDELKIALTNILPIPSSSFTFTDLVVINRLGDGMNEEANAWLLALSSLLESYAIQQSSGSTVANLSLFLDALSSEFSTAGMLDLNPRLDDLLAARKSLNPDQILQNLFFFDSSFKSELLRESGAVAETDIADFACGVFAGQILCVDPITAAAAEAAAANTAAETASVAEASAAEAAAALVTAEAASSADASEATAIAISDAQAALDAAEAAAIQAAMQALDAAEADADDEVLSAPPLQLTVIALATSINNVVADMNLFIDSDNDGLVNALDDDDDNDGIKDDEDITPYGN